MVISIGGIYIMEGKFDRVLLRPVNSLFQVLFEAFRLESFQEVITGIAIVVHKRRAPNCRIRRGDQTERQCLARPRRPYGIRRCWFCPHLRG